MRIVQVANFVSDTSGGLRTTLNHLAAGYADAGHEVVQVLPGSRNAQRDAAHARVVQLAAPALPGTGYRVLADPRRVTRALRFLRPDVLEVHDRTTLRGLGRWAQRHDVPSLVVSHERTDRWLAQWLSRRLPLTAMADRANAGLAASFDRVVCTTGWAAEEFRRLDIDNLVHVPLGVDLDRFSPRLEPVERDEVLLVMASRLSREKRPDLAVAAIRELCRRRVRVRLVVAGDGPLRDRMASLAKGLPVELRGFVPERSELAALLRSADVVLAPGPVETFGLAALEALACGTPVVVNRHSALPEVVGPDAGLESPSSGFTFANAAQELLARDQRDLRRSARARAQEFPWSRTVRRFLDIHSSRTPARRAA